MPPTVTALLAGALVFDAFCLVSLVRNEASNLPKWVWAAIICVSCPLGGLAYLAFGRAGEMVQAPELPGPLREPPDALRERRAHAPQPAGRGPVTIEVDGLAKRFGPLTAVDGLSFTVRPGQVTGFLGPNGAGKTTTMRIILGLDSPAAGRAFIGGHPYREIVRPLHRVGAVLDAGAVHPGRSAYAHVLSVAQSNGIGRRRVTEVLRLTGLESVADRRAKGFSLGMRQRLGIALALLGDPPVLMFDEPVNGLDPEGVHWIRQLFRSLAAEGRTVFVSSHLMNEMALTADHLIIIGRGRLLDDLPTAEFTEASARGDVLVRSPRPGDLARLLTAHGATVAPEGDDALSVHGLDAPAIAGLAAGHGIPVHELRHGAPRSRRRTWTSRKTASSTTPGARPGTGRPRHDNSRAPQGRPGPPGRAGPHRARPRCACLGVDEAPLGSLNVLGADCRGRRVPGRGARLPPFPPAKESPCLTQSRSASSAGRSTRCWPWASWAS